MLNFKIWKDIWQLRLVFLYIMVAKPSLTVDAHIYFFLASLSHEWVSALMGASHFMTKNGRETWALLICLSVLCRWLAAPGFSAGSTVTSSSRWMWWCAPPASSTCVLSALTGECAVLMCMNVCVYLLYLSRITTIVANYMRFITLYM